MPLHRTRLFHMNCNRIRVTIKCVQIHGNRVLILMETPILLNIFHQLHRYLSLHTVLHPLHNIFSGFVQKLARETVRGQQSNHLQFGVRRDQLGRTAVPQDQLGRRLQLGQRVQLGRRV